VKLWCNKKRQVVVFNVGREENNEQCNVMCKCLCFVGVNMNI